MHDKNLEYFKKGINRFNELDYKRNLKDPQIIWEKNGIKLRKYKSNSKKIILLIPSILNSYYILDLTRRNSFARDLSKFASVYIIDWSRSDQNINLFKDYINICKEIILYIAKNKKISVIGYCLGGIIAIASSIICQNYIDKICLIATPWDFSKLKIINKHTFIDYNYHKEVISGEIIYNVFCQLQYAEFIKKYVKFALLKDKTKINLFLTVENWLKNKDGYIRTSIMTSILNSFFIENQLYNNKYYVDDYLIDLDLIQNDVLIIIPENDKIVQKESSSILTKKIKHNQTINIDAGHIAMIIDKELRNILLNHMKNKFFTSTD